jgi:hypothetical protein
MQLNLPVQRVVDRQQPYEPYFGQKIRSGHVIAFQLADSQSSEHHPGDPSVFLQPNTRGWYCPAPSNAAACVWLGNIL